MLSNRFDESWINNNNREKIYSKAKNKFQPREKIWRIEKLAYQSEIEHHSWEAKDVEDIEQTSDKKPKGIPKPTSRVIAFSSKT